MSGPWEKYQTEAGPPADGPWAKYGKPESAPKDWRPRKRSPQDLRDSAEAYSLQHPATEGMDPRALILAGFGKSFVDTGRGVSQLFSGDGEESKAEASRVHRQDEALIGNGYGAGGNVVGQIAQLAVPVGEVAKAASVAGKAAPYVASAARSGVFSGLQPVEQGDTRAGNAAAGAAWGALGQGVSAGANRVAKGAKDLLSPPVLALYQKAQQAGIPVHYSQLSDSKFVKSLASTLGYLPFTGAAAKGKAQQEAFNKAAGRSIGASNAETLSDDVIAQAQRHNSAAYDTLFNRNAVKITPDVTSKLRDIAIQASKDLTPDKAKVVINQIQKFVGMANKKGEIPGRAYQNIRLGMKSLESNQEHGHLVREVRKTMERAANKSFQGQDAQLLKEANARHSNRKVLEKALKQVAGANGDIRPGALWPIVNQKMGSTKEMRDLARVGRMITNPVPDSGTAGRLLATGIAGGGAAAAGGLAALTPLGKLMLVGATLGRAANSEKASKYLTQGGGKTLNGLARLAKGAPIILPATAAAKKKE